MLNLLFGILCLKHIASKNVTEFLILLNVVVQKHSLWVLVLHPHRFCKSWMALRNMFLRLLLRETRRFDIFLLSPVLFLADLLICTRMILLLVTLTLFFIWIEFARTDISADFIVIAWAHASGLTRLLLLTRNSGGTRDWGAGTWDIIFDLQDWSIDRELTLQRLCVQRWHNSWWRCRFLLGRHLYGCLLADLIEGDSVYDGAIQVRRLLLLSCMLRIPSSFFVCKLLWISFFDDGELVVNRITKHGR